jgi:hypothetical protein
VKMGDDEKEKCGEEGLHDEILKVFLRRSQ